MTFFEVLKEHGITAIVGALFACVTRLAYKYKATQNGIQSILRVHILEAYEKYTEKGYITLYGKEAVHKMYEAYKGLGGNSFIDEVMESIDKLPIKK